MKKLITWLIVMFGASLPALAQTPIDVTTVRFWDAPSGTDRCRMNVISGTPSGGNTCDHIIDYATGDLWHKVSGTWVKVADLPIDLTASVTNRLPLANFVEASATGTYLRGVSSSSAVWSTLVLPNTATKGDLLTATGADTVGSIADVAVNQVLASGGVSTVAGYTANPTVATLTTTGNIVPYSIGASLIPDVTDTYDVGSATKLFNHGHIAELDTVLFALSTQTLFGGYATIGINAGSLPAVASGDTSIVFPFAMTHLDFVVIRGQDTSGAYTSEFIQVTGTTGCTTCAVTRNLSGLGAKNWAAGTPFLVRRPTTSEIDLLAYDGYPRMVISQQGSTYNAQTEQVVLGDLDGYFGYSSHLNGLAVGVPTGAWVKVDPTNGARIGYNTTTFAQVDASGNATLASASITGALAIGSGGNLHSGATSCSGTTGFWMDQTPCFFVGTTAGTPNYFKFDGTHTFIVGTDLTLGSGTSGFIASGALKFFRLSGAGYGGTGDVFGAWAASNDFGSVFEQKIAMENTAVQLTGPGNDGNARTDLIATGWQGGAFSGAAKQAKFEAFSGRLTAGVYDTRFVATGGPLQVANNVSGGYCATYASYQYLLYDGGTAPGSYGGCISSGYMRWNVATGGGYSWDENGASQQMLLTGGMLQIAKGLGVNATAPATGATIGGTTTLLSYVSCGRLSTDGSGVVICSAYPTPTYEDLESRILALEHQLGIHKENK